MQTHIHTDIQTHIHTDRHTHRQTYTHTHRQTYTQTDIHTGKTARHADMQTCADMHTLIHAYMHIWTYDLYVYTYIQFYIF